MLQITQIMGHLVMVQDSPKDKKLGWVYFADDLAWLLDLTPLHNADLLVVIRGHDLMLQTIAPLRVC